MAIDEVLRRFPDAKRNGKGWRATCPAHPDRHPSLDIDVGGNGRVLLHCRSRRCAASAIVAQAGLTMADLFADQAAPRLVPSARAASRQLGDPVATYDYRDESGAVLFQVRRYHPSGAPKTFRQFRPNGNGEWIPGIKDRDGGYLVRLVLYRLDQLQGKGAVCLVEGEKDADRLASLKLPASCNPMGAGTWKDDYAPQLVAAGVKRVAILPDNDAPGDHHALMVARSCHMAGLEVRVVRLPDLTVKGDVSDWLDAGHTAEELRACLKGALRWTPATAMVDDDTPEETRDGPVLVRLDTVQPEAVEWLWPLRLARGKLTILAGDPGLGKSFATSDIAARITRGSPWPDDGRAPLGDVLLLSAEDGLRDTIRPRLDRLDADVSRVHVLTAIREGATERTFSLDRDCSRLHAALDTTGALLVVIDPVSAYLGGTDSYKDAEVRAILAPLAQLADERRVAVCCVMHLRKSREGNALQRLSGSIGFGAAARIVLGIGKDEQEPERRLFAGVKSNLGRLAPTLAYRITGEEEAGVLEWEPDIVEGVDGEQVLTSTPVDRDEHDSAAEFFDSVLPPGDELPQRDVMRQAGDWGIGRSTLHRWKRKLGIKARKGGFKDGWLWLRPLQTASQPPKVLTKVLSAEHVSTFAYNPMNSTENTGPAPKVLTTPDSEYLRGEMSTFDGATAPSARREY